MSASWNMRPPHIYNLYKQLNMRFSISDEPIVSIVHSGHYEGAALRLISNIVSMVI